ncbi:MAG: integrase core domain-containing protein [Spirochaetales bacterium]|uniref:Integrase core domain-containing protein n=1 Tax=Candidatus Thalassospirochaeta sargassi TaxID=3119039 RepID=A0AAJ1IEQ8_9SPIO|nr:integrase core domain-containing protein [Spirochaetales bacterium]
MFNFAVSLLKTLFSIIFKKRKDVIFTFFLLKKENEIMKRHLNLSGKKITSNHSDRFCLSLITALSKRAINHLTIVKPETLLEWQRRFIKKRWSFKHKKRGRKPVNAELKNLILEMKTDNPLWGCRRISDELKKLNIKIHHTTVNKIIQTFRKQGKIQSNGSWKKFLKTHWDSLYGMDFATIDTLLGKRFYLLIILELKSRRIIRYDLTENPCREFVKQRLELFAEGLLGEKTLIHDNALQFTSIEYSWFDIEGVNICTSAPNMNAYTERFIGSIRREALNHFLLFSEKQVRKIIKSYVDYYNHQRPHQGLDQIPAGRIVSSTGKIKKERILGGLHHNYYRSSA